MKIDEIMFSQKELDLMAPKPKEKKEDKPKQPPRYATPKEKKQWAAKQKAEADIAAFKKFEKEKKDKELAAQNTPEAKAKRRREQIDADLKKISSTGRTKATDTDTPAPSKKRPAKKTYGDKEVDYFTNFAHKTDN
jgi:hypothetical protein